MPDDKDKKLVAKADTRYTVAEIDTLAAEGKLAGYKTPFPKEMSDIFRGDGREGVWQPVVAINLFTMRNGEPHILVAVRSNQSPTLVNSAGPVTLRPDIPEVAQKLSDSHAALHYPDPKKATMQVAIGSPVTIGECKPAPQPLDKNSAAAVMVREALARKFGLTDISQLGKATVSMGALTMGFVEVAKATATTPAQYEPVGMQGVVVFVENPDVLKADGRNYETIRWVPLEDYRRVAKEKPEYQNLTSLMPGVSPETLQNVQFTGLGRPVTLDMTCNAQELNAHCGYRLESDALRKARDVAKGTELKWRESKDENLGTKPRPNTQQKDSLPDKGYAPH